MVVAQATQHPMMHLAVVSVGKTLLHSSAMHERCRRKWDENGLRSGRFALLIQDVSASRVWQVELPVCHLVA